MRGHHVPGSVSLMPRVVQGRGAGVIVVVAGLVCGHLLAQDTPPVSISPSNATIVVGETRSFRAVDKNERMLHDVHWTASEPAVLDLAPDDEVEITAKQVGRCTLTAHTSQGPWGSRWRCAAAGHSQVECCGPSRMPHLQDLSCGAIAQRTRCFRAQRLLRRHLCAGFHLRGHPALAQEDWFHDQRPRPLEGNRLPHRPP